MAAETSTKDPIINSHAHIFTSKHVPPYLAKSFLPWPFYYLFPIPFILRIFKWFLTSKNDQRRFTGAYKEKQRKRIRRLNYIRRNPIIKTIFGLVIILLVIQFLYCLYSELARLLSFQIAFFENAFEFLQNIFLLLPIDNPVAKWAFIIFILSATKVGRNLVLFLLKMIGRFFSMLPDDMTKALISRYILLGRFVIYKNQTKVFTKLKGQYPPGTKFVILPMDMEYMDAGKLKPENSYHEQMKVLAELKKVDENKDIFLPFVFVDPRRMRDESDFLKYTIKEGSVKLEDCFIKKYIEGENKFSGFKIYPALGYYPFEEELLPLWKYAADRDIPILTHCIRGTIFYRGKKKKIWDEHPVFEENIRGDENKPLLLPENKNVDFTINFTHPMNFLCLLEESQLRKLVGKAKNKRIKELFGYTDESTPLKHDLRNLKICFGHYGGEDQWEKYLEKDRYDHSLQLMKYKDKGLDFFYNIDGSLSKSKIEQIWKYADWYSIISSMMLQYPNVYSDISYILHGQEIFPLLKYTLRTENEKLRSRVLFGTDFFVVRNHKSDKNILIDTESMLTEEEFDLIARKNPKEFLHI